MTNFIVHKHAKKYSVEYIKLCKHQQYLKIIVSKYSTVSQIDPYQLTGRALIRIH